MIEIRCGGNKPSKPQKVHFVSNSDSGGSLNDNNAKRVSFIIYKIPILPETVYSVGYLYS